MRTYGCEILIEAPGVRNDKDMALVEALLQDRDADSPSSDFTPCVATQLINSA